MNLLSNAIKYTEKGFIKIEVEEIAKNDIINTPNCKQMVKFTVSDSGIGMTK